MADWVEAMALKKLKKGRLRGVRVRGEDIVLANDAGVIYALRDQCSHEDLPLSDGDLEDGEVVCLYHGARFDCVSGRNTGLPAVRPVKSYPVEIRGGSIYVDLG